MKKTQANETKGIVILKLITEILKGNDNDD